MKSDRGITITSLIIYVIAMLIVIGIIANITAFFYRNVLNLEDESYYVRGTFTSKNLDFSKEELNDKDVINVLITIGDNMEYTKTTKFVMK